MLLAQVAAKLETLTAAGAIVDYHDPYVRALGNRRSINLATARPDDYDVAVVVTPHADFDLAGMRQEGWPLFDTRHTPQQEEPLDAQDEPFDRTPKPLHEAAHSR